MFYVPDLQAHQGLHEGILYEAHYSRLMVHLGSAKIYHVFFPYYWGPRLKKDVLDTLSPVKIEHQRL